eukprot:scaffold46296_cov37-Prasinocladus_malaysianus.AAC.1
MAKKKAKALGEGDNAVEADVLSNGKSKKKEKKGDKKLKRVSNSARRPAAVEVADDIGPVVQKEDTKSKKEVRTEDHVACHRLSRTWIRHRFALGKLASCSLQKKDKKKKRKAKLDEEPVEEVQQPPKKKSKKSKKIEASENAD